MRKPRVNKTEYVTMRMTPAEAEALRAVAKERSCSVGAVVRWSVHVALLNERLPEPSASLTATQTNGVHQ